MSFKILRKLVRGDQDKYYLAEKEALEKFRKKYKEKYDTKAETFKKEVN